MPGASAAVWSKAMWKNSGRAPWRRFKRGLARSNTGTLPDVETNGERAAVRPGSRKLARDAIKHVAVIAMLLNHVGRTFFTPDDSIFWILVDPGFLTAPVMCWFLVQGYYKTRSRKRYALRLVFFAVLSQPVYDLWHAICGMDTGSVNMLFTLSVCFLILTVRNGGLPRMLKIFLIGMLTALTSNMTWPVLSCIAVLLFDIWYERPAKVQLRIFAVIAGLLAYCQTFGFFDIWHGVGSEYLFQASFAWICVLAAGYLVAYQYDPDDGSKKPGRLAKYYFYAFYPGHLLVLTLIRFCIMSAMG